VLNSVRQPCRHILWILISGFRPVALRPTLSDGLPLFNLLLHRTYFDRTLEKTQVLRQHYDFT
jgi:hypothetical protein